MEPDLGGPLEADAVPRPAILEPSELFNLLEKTDAEVVAENLYTPWAMDSSADGGIPPSERPGGIRIIKQGRLEAGAWMTLEDAEEGLACGLLAWQLIQIFRKTALST